MSEIKIISKHETLSKAVAASGMDLSYNEQEANNQINNLEGGFRGAKAGEAFVTEDGVYYVLKCDITLLNKFSPFCGVLHDGPFRVVVVSEDKIHVCDAGIPCSTENRKRIAELGVMVTK